MQDDIFPTLLIGLGGAGCQIAQGVHERAEAIGLDKTGQIAVVGFDTALQDIRKRRGAGARADSMVQFSTASQVLPIMRRHPKIADSWFYSEDELGFDIKNLTLDQGAGQVRILTRLALHDAVSRGEVVNELSRKLQSLATYNNRDSFQGSVHAYIIASLAGATGCGSFLQIAFILRQLARAAQIRNISVRGLFLLPDIFVKGAGLTRAHEENVLINGGAALRELNGLMQIANDRIPRGDLEFEFMPGHDIELGGVPFDTVTLLDFETNTGQSIGSSLDYYTALAEEVAFTQLFSPIGAEFSSRAVNSIQQRLEAAAVGMTNSYSSIGLYRLVYPEQAVLQYLTWRFAALTLDADWLYLDRLHQQEMAIHEERRRQGDVASQPPDRGESFREGMRSMASQNRQPYRDIVDSVHRDEEDEFDAVVRVDQHKRYLDALEDHLVNGMWSRAALRTLREEAQLQRSQFGDRGELAQTVRQRETLLDRRWREAVDSAGSVPDVLYENLQAEASTAQDGAWQAHHLQAYILNPARSLLEVRYFLYCLRDELDARAGAIDSRGMKTAVETASMNPADDRREGGRSGWSALPLAEEVEAQGVFSRMLRNKLESFKSRYAQHYNSQLSSMRGYLEAALKERVYEKLAADVDILINLLELLFSDLEQFRERLEADIKQAETAHDLERGVEQSSRYVYADARAKQAIWEGLRSDVGSTQASDAANAALVGALLAEQAERRAARGRRVGDAFSVRAIFQEVMVDGHCKNLLEEDFSNFFRFNIIEASRREATLIGREWDDAFADIVTQIQRQTEPFIMLSDTTDSSGLTYWTMPPSLKESIGDERMFEQLFSQDQEERALIDPAFDDRSLTCVNIAFDFTLQNVAKLRPAALKRESIHDVAAGRYDKGYRDRLTNLRRARAENPDRPPPWLTPHLDKRWDVPGSLPEVFEEIAAGDDDALYRGFAAAIALGLARFVDEGGRAVTTFEDPAQIAKGFATRKLRDGHDIGPLFTQFRAQPDLAFSSERALDARLGANGGAGAQAFETSKLAQAYLDPDALVRYFQIAANRNDAQSDGTAGRLVRAHFTTLAGIVEQIRSDLRREDQAAFFLDRCANMITKARARAVSRGLLPEDIADITVRNAEAQAEDIGRRWRER